MRNLIRLRTALSTIAAIALILSLPLAAQTREGVMGDLLKDTSDVEKKVMALANAMPESAYAWRPGPGVRATGEVFQHLHFKGRHRLEQFDAFFRNGISDEDFKLGHRGGDTRQETPALNPQSRAFCPAIMSPLPARWERQ